MIRATVYPGDFMEVEVDRADLPNFSRAIPASERRWDEFKRIWVVKHPARYARYPFVAAALLLATCQLRLF